MEGSNFINPQDLKIYQSDKASVDSQVATAKAYPRDLEKCMTDIKAIILSDKETAEECIYSLPRAGKALQGPSVVLAKIIAQSMGNMRFTTRVVGISDKHITAEAIAWDLEKNIASQVQVQRLIIGSKGRYNDDMITVTGNAANSIALRNAIFNVIPTSITEIALKTARNKISGDVSTADKLLAAAKKVVDALISQYKVTEKEILDSIKRASFSHILQEDIVTLIGFGTAIKNGDSTIDEIFRPEKVKAAAAATQMKTQEQQESERLLSLISKATTVQALEKYKQHLSTPEERESYDKKFKDLQDKAKQKSNA